VQAELDALGVPYTGCDSVASRLAFDKVQTKLRCLERGIPTARYFTVNRPDAPCPADWKPPLVVKPVRQGSSVGLAFVNDLADWPAALRAGFEHGDELLVEERIVGREVTVGILGGEPLPVVEVRPRAGNYDYANKYTPGRTEYLCPAPFDAEVTRRIQQAGFGAFLSVGGRDYGRVDVMVAHDRDPYVLEVNTLPGMTETSLFPKAAAAAGFSYEQLCQRMVELVLHRRPVPAL
jgi:D-alanine-D-alanine ligase